MLEFHITYHCNLSCALCTHFSPSAPAYVVPVKNLSEQVTLAAYRLDPEVVHILGGEPLLHPHVPDILSATRGAFPKAVIKLVSNGTLFLRQAGPLVRALAADNIIFAVSLYPSVPVNRIVIAESCAAGGASYEFWPQETILDFLDLTGGSESGAARATCSMGDALNIRDDRLYPCPVSAWCDFGGAPLALEDGVLLTETVEALRKVLDPQRTTSRCRYCRCSPGRRPHSLGSRNPIFSTEVKNHV